MTYQKPSVISKMLDDIDTKNYASGLVHLLNDVSSTHYALLQEPEVLFLIQHKEQALPLMLAHLKENNLRCYQKTRMVYFVIFEKWRDYLVLPAVADYLEAWNVEDECGVGSDYGRYALQTALKVVEAITGEHQYVSPPPGGGLKREAIIIRGEFRVRDEFEKRYHIPPPTP